MAYRAFICWRLVLVQMLHLNVEDGIGVQLHALVVCITGPIPACFQFYRGAAGAAPPHHSWKSQQLFQLWRVLFEAGADQALDERRPEAGCSGQPAAEGDAVGLVVELFRALEGPQLGFKISGVQGRPRCLRCSRSGCRCGPCVPGPTSRSEATPGSALTCFARSSTLHHGSQLRHCLTHKVHGPFFQRLGQNGCGRCRRRSGLPPGWRRPCSCPRR